MYLTNRYVFDNVEFLAADRRLLVNGRAVSIGSRAVSVLQTLLTHRDRVVTKRELLDSAWPNVVVEQNNLVVQVAALRRVLGRSAITTIPGRGYKFSAAEARVAQALTGKRPVLSPSKTTVTLDDAATEHPRDPRRSPLVGRADDLRSIGALMARHRIVTLVGTTGIGKTRVAQQLVADAARRFAHGAAWVELAPAADERLVVDAIVRALKLDLRAEDPLDGLSRAVRPLNMLVVIDNADEALDEVARIVQTLAAEAPGMSFLLTGHMPLHVRDEKVVPLSALAVPPHDTLPEAAMHFGAVALFVERASAADSRFTLTRDNVASVIEICRRLDGVALGIDMAASRATLVGMPELTEMLSKRLDLLSTSRRDAQPRHQTLRRAIEWSHGLLGERERVVLRRLSVFARGFTLDAARAVVAWSLDDPYGIDEWAALDAFTELINRSLMIVDSNDPPRYRLLESTQIFAREQLDLTNETAVCQRRHAIATRTALLAIFEARHHDWDLARGQLTIELDNARQALTWALEHDPLTAVQLAPPVSWGLVTSSTAGLDMWMATENLLASNMPVRARAQWATGASFFRQSAWQPRRLEWARVAVQLWRDVGEREGLQIALTSMARLIARDDPAEQRRLLEESHALDTPDMAPGIRTLQAQIAAHAALHGGTPEQAIPAFEYALRSAVTSRNSDAQDTLLIAIAHAEHVANRPADAVRRGRELVERFRGTRKTHSLSNALCHLASASLSLHDHAGARRALAEAWPLARVHGRTEDCCDGFALISALEGSFEAAARLRGLADALRAKAKLPRDPAVLRLAGRAHHLILDALGATRLQQLLQHGAELSPDDVPAWAWNAAPEASHKLAVACS